MFSYIYAVVKKIYYKVAYIESDKNIKHINLENSFLVLLNLKNKPNQNIYFFIDNSFDLTNKNSLLLYLKTTIISGFKFIPRDSFFNRFLIFVFKGKRFWYFFLILVSFFFVFICYNFGYFQFLNYLNFGYFRYNIYTEKVIQNYDFFNLKFLYSLISSENNLFINYLLFEKVEHIDHIIRGFGVNGQDARYFFSIKKPLRFNLFIIDNYYYSYITQLIDNISPIFIIQYIKYIWSIIFLYPFLFSNLLLDNFFNEVYYNYLFWFSWGLFYIKLFFILNIDFEELVFFKFNNLLFLFKSADNIILKNLVISNNFNQEVVYRTGFFKFLFNENLTYIDNFSYEKRWYVFQNYLNDDLDFFYSNKVSTYDYLLDNNTNNSNLIHRGSLFDSRKLIKKRWLSLSNDNFFWLYEDEDY